MADSKNDYLRIDATNEFTTELSQKMDPLFPLMGVKGVSRESFLQGEVLHVSVAIPSNTESNQEFKENLIALLKAGKNPSHPAFSEHGGDKHGTYVEAIDTLIQCVQDGQFSLKLQATRKEVGSRNNKKKVLVSR